MSRVIELRWFKWNKLIIDEKYSQVVEDFDKMVKDGTKISVGDVVLRDQALELMGVLSISSLSDIKKDKNDKAGKRKS